MGQKVLIVEDQFLEARSLSIMLKSAGHLVEGIAKSVDKALGFVDRNPPDVVLLDIFLQGPRNGVDLARILDSRNIPFIYLSANSNTTILEEAIATRPSGFLVKPFRGTGYAHCIGYCGVPRSKAPGVHGKAAELVSRFAP